MPLEQEVIDSVDSKTGLSLEDKRGILAEAVEYFDLSNTAESRDRTEANKDERFVIGEQWEPEDLQERKGRPSLVMNLYPKFIYGLAGEQRQNSVTIKARPVDSVGDPATAGVIDGLIRQIQYVSSADVARSTAFQQALIGGRGYYEIDTVWADENSFDQEIRIRRIKNHYSVYLDPHTVEFDKSDMKWALITEKISKIEFRRRYGIEAPMADFPKDGVGLGQHWVDQDTVRVARYWRVEEEEGTLYEYVFADGRKTTSQDPDDARIGIAGGARSGRERETKVRKVKKYDLSLHEVHEARDWPGSFIPIIPVLGQEIFVAGESHLVGVVRFSRDAQRMFNFNWSSATESVAKSPKDPVIGTESMFEGHENQWANSNKTPYAYLVFNTDPERPGDKPSRIGGPSNPTAFVNLLQVANEGMRATTTIFESNIGEKSNEVSGRAILARQRQGDNNTFVFIDNLARAVALEGRILIDLIPKVYDGERIVRILGADGVPDVRVINRNPEAPLLSADQLPASQLTDDGQVSIYDLGLGKYDVVSTIGPSFATRRIELVNAYTEIMRVFPQITPFIIDIVVKNLDTAGAEELMDRIKAFQSQFGQQGNGNQPPGGPGQAPSPAGVSAEQAGSQGVA